LLLQIFYRQESQDFKKYCSETFSIDPTSFLGLLLKYLPAGASILDIGCGFGRDLLWFKNKGFRATGFERASNHNIIAERQGDELKISGVRYGEVYEETVELEERPWYQPLSYSLRNFLGSEAESMSFWTIRTDTVEATTLQVKKAGEEEITINGKRIMAQKVELRAEGLFFALLAWNLLAQEE
jgi:SAM-dependent methyltransferase